MTEGPPDTNLAPPTFSHFGVVLVKMFSRVAVVVTASTVGVLTASGSAAAAPSCIGQSLTYQGANAFVKTLGLKNLGESFSTEAREFGGIGEQQASATKTLIADCR